MEVTGEILLKSKNEIEWKVPYFFSLTNKINYQFQSPEFRCLQGTWILYCYLNDTYPYRIYICLQEKHSVSKRNLTYRMGIKEVSGLEFISRTCKTDKIFLYLMDLFVDVDFLNKHKDTVAPTGELTFFCILGAEPSEEAAHPEVKDVATETTEKYFGNLAEESDDSEEISSNLEGACVLSVNPPADSSKTNCEDDAVSSEFTSTSGLNNLILNLLDIYLNEKHSDLAVMVKEQEFKVHKLILGARSSVFSAMFAHDTKENISNTVEITDCEPETFRHFLTFLYSGQVEKVPGKQVFDLYYIADKYNVEELKESCANFLSDHITIDNFCDVMSLALRHKETKLLETATNYFIKHAKEINMTVKWLSFIKEYPIECNELYIKTLNYSIS